MTCTENATDGLKMDTIAFNTFPELEGPANEWRAKDREYQQFAEQTQLLDKMGAQLNLKRM